MESYSIADMLRIVIAHFRVRFMFFAVETTNSETFQLLQLDAAVLRFQNQKLLQKLETQKVEINALEDRLCQLRDKQYSYEKTLAVVDNSWKEVHKYDAILIINLLLSWYSLFSHYT